MNYRKINIQREYPNLYRIIQSDTKVNKELSKKLLVGRGWPEEQANFAVELELIKLSSKTVLYKEQTGKPPHIIELDAVLNYLFARRELMLIFGNYQNEARNYRTFDDFINDGFEVKTWIAPSHMHKLQMLFPHFDRFQKVSPNETDQFALAHFVTSQFVYGNILKI